MIPERPRPRIGLLVQGIAYSYQNDIFMGAHEECRRQGVDLLCFSGGDLGVGAKDPRNAVYGLVTPEALDGLLVATGTMNTALGSAQLDALLRAFARKPICSLACQVPGCLSVLIDNTSSVTTLTQHLIDVHGCRRVAFIAGRGPESDVRLAGYLEGLRSRDLPVDAELQYPGDFRGDSGVAAVGKLFAPGLTPPDAIIAANDWMALGALQELKSRGIRVPEDIALAGFDDIDDARFVLPSLTTVEQPSWQLGAAGIQSILAALRGECVPDVYHLTTVVRVRRSCGCFGPSSLRQSVFSLAPAAPGQERPSLSPRARVIAANAPDVGGSLPEGWAEHLATALQRDLDEGTDYQFARLLEEYLHGTAHLGNVAAWHAMVLALRAKSAVPQEDEARYETLNKVCELAQITVGSQAEHIQGKRRLEKETLLRELSAMSSAVRTATDHASMAQALVTHLPLLGIHRAYVVGNTTELVPHSPSTLVLAYAQGEGQLNDNEAPDPPFLAGQFYPEGYSPKTRSSMVVFPAFFGGDELLGYCLFEVGALDGAVYETVHEQISVALKATQLLRAVVEEVTRRERAERARLEGEIDIARHIQTAVLPRALAVEGLEVATLMVPATEVGGDYFDVLPFQGGAWLAIGDVAGHGLEAGLIMLMIQSIMAALAESQQDAMPDVIWEKLNHVLSENIRTRLGKEDHATLNLLRYTSDGQVVHAGAHEDIIVFRADQRCCEFIPTLGIWAGILTKLPPDALQTGRFRLQQGDLMLLYTDGIIEARNTAGEEFGPDRLCQVLVECHRVSVQEICDTIRDAVTAWTDHQSDDFSVVVLRQTGPA